MLQQRAQRPFVRLRRLALKPRDPQHHHRCDERIRPDEGYYRLVIIFSPELLEVHSRVV